MLKPDLSWEPSVELPSAVSLGTKADAVWKEQPSALALAL